MRDAWCAGAPRAKPPPPSPSPRLIRDAISPILDGLSSPFLYLYNAVFTPPLVLAGFLAGVCIIPMLEGIITHQVYMFCGILCSTG